VNKSELIGHVAMMSSIDNETAIVAVVAAPDRIVSTLRGRDKVSLLDIAGCIPARRAARQGRNPRVGPSMQIDASQGVRFATGSPFAAAHNAKSGATKAAPAKAAKAPAKAFATSVAPAAAVTSAKKR